ncbi:MAG: hypothetical protein I3274_04480 [Candidatus Moeniiplasma glomeromycotorum]|nr:hypothetical protein [Candidatus Moeniiplasma glomeromycotorum]
MAKATIYCPYKENGCKNPIGKNFDTDIYYDGQLLPKVCDNSACQQKQKEEQKEKIRKLSEYKLEQEKDNIRNLIQEIMDKGWKIETDFEKYDWLTESEKEKYRQYNKRCQNIEDLEKQKRDLLKCQVCQQIPANGKYYEVNGEGNYCKNCAKNLINSSDINNSSDNKNPCDKCGLSVATYYTVGKKGHYCSNCADKLIEESKSNSSSNNSSNDNESAEKCDKCGQKIGKGEKSYYADSKNKTGTLCLKCWKEKQFESEIDTHVNQNSQCKAIGEAFDKIVNKKERVDLSKLNLSKQAKTILEALMKIHLDRKWVDVDRLNIQTKHKKELKRAMEELEIEKPEEDFKNSKLGSELKSKAFYKKPWFIIGAIIISLVPLVIVIRNSRTRKKRIKKRREGDKK